MIEPASESLAELRVINEVVASRQFPVGVESTNYDVVFGEDAAGSAAVWIRLGVDEEHSNPSKEWVSQVSEFVSKLRRDLLDRHIRHWPYIELKAGSRLASQ